MYVLFLFGSIVGVAKGAGLCFPSLPALSAKPGGSGAAFPERGCGAGGPGRAFLPFEVAGAGFQGARDTPGHVTEQEASGMLGGFQRTGEMLGSGSPGGLGFPVCIVSC